MRTPNLSQHRRIHGRGSILANLRLFIRVRLRLLHRMSPPLHRMSPPSRQTSPLPHPVSPYGNPWNNHPGRRCSLRRPPYRPRWIRGDPCSAPPTLTSLKSTQSCENSMGQVKTMDKTPRELYQRSRLSRFSRRLRHPHRFSRRKYPSRLFQHPGWLPRRPSTLLQYGRPNR